METIKTAIETYCKNNNDMPMKTFSERTGITTGTLRGWMDGTGKPTRPKSLNRLNKLLGTTFKVEDYKNPAPVEGEEPDTAGVSKAVMKVLNTLGVGDTVIYKDDGSMYLSKHVRGGMSISRLK